MGFGIWDFGFWIWDLGFGIWDLGFWIWDFGFWICRDVPVERLQLQRLNKSIMD